MSKNTLDRRAFFMRTGVSLGGAALLYSCHQPGETWSFLTESEAKLLDAVLDRIIPGDQDPGARDAGVIYFIDRQLAGTYARYQESYRSGLQSLAASCQSVRGAAFESLAPEDQTAVLEQLERNEAPAEHWKSQSASSFFGMVVNHAMQGFYGSPIHGGNKDFTSYKMLGIALPIDYEGSPS